MKMIRITEEKKEKLSMHAEKILSAAGKLMQCLESMDEESDDEEDEYDMDDRRSYDRKGMRNNYGMSGERRNRENRNRFID